MHWRAVVNTGRGNLPFALSYSDARPPPTLPPLQEPALCANFRTGQHDQLQYPQLMPDVSPWMAYIERIAPHHNLNSNMVGYTLCAEHFCPIAGGPLGTLDPRVDRQFSVAWEAIRVEFLQLAERTTRQQMVPRAQSRILDNILPSLKSWNRTYESMGQLVGGVARCLADVCAFMRYRDGVERGSNTVSHDEYDCIGGFSPHIEMVQRAYQDGYTMWWMTSILLVSVCSLPILNPEPFTFYNPAWSIPVATSSISLAPVPLPLGPDVHAHGTHVTRVHGIAATISLLTSTRAPAGSLERSRPSRSRLPGRLSGVLNNAANQRLSAQGDRYGAPRGWVRCVQFQHQHGDPSNQPQLNHKWHGILNAAQLAAWHRVDDSEQRQWRLVTDVEMPVQQTWFTNVRRTLVPPPHMFGGTASKARVIVPNYMAAAEFVEARIVSQDGYSGLEAKLWDDFLQGRLYRDAPPTILASPSSTASQTPAIGHSVPIVDHDSIEQRFIRPRKLNEGEDRVDHPLFGRYAQPVNGYTLRREHTVATVYGTDVDFSTVFRAGVDAENLVFRWAVYNAWRAREILARTSILQVETVIMQATETSTIIRTKREQQLVELWNGDWFSNGIVPARTALNPLVSPNAAQRHSAILKFAHFTASWPRSAEIQRWVWISEARKAGNASFTGQEWNDLEEAVWLHYVQTHFDLFRHIPVLSVALPLQDHELPWAV